MEKLQLFLLILQVAIALVMIISILIQRSDGDSLGGIGGGSGGLGAGISAKASASALSKFTIFLVAFFILNSLLLARISAVSNSSSELQIDKVIEETLPENNKPFIPPVE
jgi:preprotein translocase subunit SecG